MDFNKFSFKIINDLQKYFKDVVKNGFIILIRKDSTCIEMDMRSVYREFQITQDYTAVLQNNIDALQEALTSYKYQFSKNNIYPFLKHRSNFSRDSGTEFLRKHFCENLDIFFVADLDSTFKFLTSNDVTGINNYEEYAFQNLNKITNSLCRLDENLDIYSLKWDTDYAATMILADSIKSKICRCIGKNYLFAIPSSSSLLVSPISSQYLNLLRHLISLNYDINSISNDIYVCKSGKYSIFAKVGQGKDHLKVLK